MRKLRVVFTTMGAVPALLATILVPAVDGCGSDPATSAFDGGPLDGGPLDAAQDSLFSDEAPRFLEASPGADAPEPLCPSSFEITHIVEIPPPGVVAEPGQICAVSQPVPSNAAARVTLTRYSQSQETAVGFIALTPAVAATVVGLPTVTVTSATKAAFSGLTVSNMTRIEGGFRFLASWPGPLPRSIYGDQMTVKASFTIACADGETRVVESLTKIDRCIDGSSFTWVSSGDACTVCQVIAEMAPSPIVSDNRGDDLPLGRVIRIRVVEVARAGRQVLLFAENDAGEDAGFEWRASGGTLLRIADDVMLWSMPEEGPEQPFGQVAVWNQAGAVVENFVWGAA